MDVWFGIQLVLPAANGSLEYSHCNLSDLQFFWFGYQLCNKLRIVRNQLQCSCFCIT